MAEREVELAYDRRADVLYLTLVPGVPAVTVELEAGVLARINPDTDELVGVTVVGLSERVVTAPARVEPVEGELHFQRGLALA